jgi:glycosyltransferase involved in cell wall biosynthesis
MNNPMVPRINPISDEGHRPIWSVMIPVYNRVKYLRQALESVVTQGYGQNDMEIEVVDDHSEHNEAESIVREVCRDRISFYRQPHRLGLVSNWNACIERARGHLIHILHDDDFVANGYYNEITALRKQHPELGLYATRTFLVDDESVVTSVSRRWIDLETPKRSPEPFFCENPFLFPGVTVRRTCYETLGGFRTDLGFVSDWEMWARINDRHGAVISCNVLASHRVYTEHASNEYKRTATGGRDTVRLYEIFAKRYCGFSLSTAKNKAAEEAWAHYNHFKFLGDEPAAKANRLLWVELTPLRERTARGIRAVVMPAIRRLVSGRYI